MAAAAPSLRHVVGEIGGLDLNVRTTLFGPHYALPQGKGTCTRR
ncbi:hypothetical protein [Roseitranquillus sediminis]|nr:hypothetical protein [Roseitranquillus sediminis]